MFGTRRVAILRERGGAFLNATVEGVGSFVLAKKMFGTRWGAILRERVGVFLNVTVEGVGYRII